jgi:hypothetical protein
MTIWDRIKSDKQFFEGPTIRRRDTVTDILEKAITRLESIEDIKRLKHTYMDYCDQGYPPAKLGPLFTDDAVWTSEIFGRHDGRNAIEEFFGGVSNDIVFAAHLALNGTITVNGNAATGQWRLLMPCTLMEDGTKVSRWMLGEYDEAYRLVDGTWYFSKIDVFMNFNVRTDENWAQTASARI